MNHSKPVLSDHRRVGKEFIPPFIDKLGAQLQETSWIKQSIPELIWIALLNNRYGYKRGADLSLSLSKAVKAATGKTDWFAPLSSFSHLSSSEMDSIISKLEVDNKLLLLREGLYSLNYYYPKCPLFFLNDKKSQIVTELTEIKRVLVTLFDKRSKEATFTQANAVYISFILGKLKVSSDSSLANFPEIENYPHTEESKKIASFVRASINGFIGLNLNNNPTDWYEYFWNRGLEIDTCE